MKYLRMMIIGLLISLSSSYVLVTLSVLSNNAVASGTELLEQIIIAAILGIAIGLVSFIFDIEPLPFMVQLLLHLIAVTICVLIAGYFGGWFKHAGVKYVLISEAIIYFIVWCILYILQLNDIEKNESRNSKEKGIIRMTFAIKVENLCKQYGVHNAVNGISFTVEQGTLFAFLGANGAGKSTTIEILCTLLKKSSGNVTINGFKLDVSNDNADIRKSIGVVFQQSLLDTRLTVRENILHRGRTYGLSKTQLAENYQFVSSYLHLDDIEKQKYGTLSGGQKRRADIARALIHRPTILFLDEPTTGLDPQTRQFVWQAIRQLQLETNMTVFLTTHYMEEATVAHQVLVLKEGKIVAQGTPDALKTKYAYDSMAVVFNNPLDGAKWLEEHAITYTEKQEIYTIRLESTLQALSLLKKAEPLIASFEVIKGTMDDVFLHIMAEEGVA